MSEEAAAEAALLPGYAGHADAPARRRSDQQVRAWVGERLVDLQDRLPIDAYHERVDALLIRCEFADQHVIRAIEDQRFARPDAAAAVEVFDRRLVEAATRARSVSVEEVTGLLETLERAFDERAAAIAGRLQPDA